LGKSISNRLYVPTVGYRASDWRGERVHDPNSVSPFKEIPFFVSEKSTCLEGLSKMIAEKTVKPIIEKIYPLKDLAEANRRVETGRVAGKVCIDVKSIWSTS
jgi:NADPH:quinone reductase-like Zn-dependent oxidoreductase